MFLCHHLQEVVLQNEMRDVTLESIAGVFFGDYATPELMKDIKRLLPVLANGLFSLPVRFPWPLNQLPVLGFGRSMNAREEFKLYVLNVLKERRADWASAEEGNSGGKSAGLLDSLLMTQRNQMDLTGGQDFDDDFIFDNVRAYTSQLGVLNTVASTAVSAWCEMDTVVVLQLM